MLLAIDIGNTDTVIGLFEGERIKNDFRIASAHNLTPDEVGLFITSLLEKFNIPVEKIKSIIIGSVVPPLTPVYESAAEKFFRIKPMVVSPLLNLPIKIEIDNPDELGADRIANSVAGFAGFGGELIMVDFGTATTFDVVNNNGAYIGGVIIPGMMTSMAELSRKASRLFEVKLEQPEKVVGKSTASALRSGLFYGNVGQVDFIIEKIIAECQFADPTTIATGGLAGVIAGGSVYIGEICPTLTLEGLRLISEQN